MRRILITILFSLIASSVYAQNTATFNQPNVTSTTQAQSFVYKIYTTPANSITQNPPITLASVTCTGTPPTVSCTGTLTDPTAVVTGAKSVITATDPVSNTESAQSLPFTQASAVPTSLTIK